MAKDNGHGAGKNGGRPKTGWNEATVKSFNPKTGWGFLNSPQTKHDIVIHQRVAIRCNVSLNILVAGQRVMVRWRDGPQGRPQATSLKLPA